MSDSASYRQILRSSSVTAGAAGLNILIGLFKIKVVAVLLGPTGVGLVGLMQSVMTTAASVASLGFGTVGTQRIAAASGRQSDSDLANAKRVLTWGSLVLAVAGGFLVWAIRAPIAAQVLNDASMTGQVGWLALGVTLSVAGGAQSAALNGLRRIGDMARLSVGSALASTILGIAALGVWGRDGIPACVIAVPLATFALGHWYAAKLPLLNHRTSNLALITQLKQFAIAGVPFMLSGAVVTGGQLAVRSLVQHHLGAEALGHFQAAWTIAMTYMAFVLAAMASDFYPRLAATLQDSAAGNLLVNQQTQVALLLAAPVLVLMVGLAPHIVALLFTYEFKASADLLRWLVVGDVLKIASWPLGFMILARGDGRTFLLTESVSTAIFVVLTWSLLPSLGLIAVGVGFIAMYVVYLALVFALARHHTGFAWTTSISFGVVALLSLCLGSVCLAQYKAWAGVAISAVAGLVLTLFALIRLAGMADSSGPLGRLALRLKWLPQFRSSPDDK